MKIEYTTSGVCASKILIDMNDDHVVESVQFVGGCSGNTQGVGALAVGQKAEDLIEKLKDIRCGFKPTSCPAQLANALSQAINA